MKMYFLSYELLALGVTDDRLLIRAEGAAARALPEAEEELKSLAVAEELEFLRVEVVEETEAS